MAFWDIFKQPQTETKQTTSIYDELKTRMPNSSEDELVEVACIAGLLARVAYVDFEITPEEESHIVAVLKEWTELPQDMIIVIANLAMEHVKELAGMENHLYVHQLKTIIDQDTRFEIVEALFALAASDGVVENIESEEIRIIVKGFDLSDQHFLAARAKVADKLAALKR
jgi:uncharacterized tellurite resistance protein B-like protein